MMNTEICYVTVEICHGNPVTTGKKSGVETVKTTTSIRWFPRTTLLR